MRTSRRRPDRRGATLVLIAVLTVPLVTLAAFALDAGWWQVGANQLQTTADAAALAGARALQLYPTSNTQTKAEAYAAQTAANNRAFSQAVAVTGADVEPMYWTASSGTLSASTWAAANAVRVTARATPGLMLGGLLRSSAPAVARQGVAWIANVNSGTCVKPWSLPYEELYDRVTSLTGIASTATSPGAGRRPDLSQAQVAALAVGSYAEAARTLVFYGPNTAAAVPAGASGISAYDGRWEGYNFSGNAGNQSYQANIFGCDLTNVSVTQDNGTTLPGNGTDYECWTLRALTGSSAQTCQSGWIADAPTHAVSCHYKAPTTTGSGANAVTAYDAGCYASTSAATLGTQQKVAWGDYVGVGSNAVDHRVIGTVRVLCVFRGLSASATGGGNGNGGSNGGGSNGGGSNGGGSNGGGSNGGGSNGGGSNGGGNDGGGSTGAATESCMPAGGVALTGLPIGTLVVAIEGLSTMTIDAATELGNVTSTNQRLILVR